MRFVRGTLRQVLVLSACTVLLSLAACSQRVTPTPPARPAQAPSVDPRFPSDTIPQQSAAAGEWLFWVMPSEDLAAAACLLRGGTELEAKAAAHTCAANYHGRRYYSVGGCTDPQRLTYATSADGNFTWHVCADPRSRTLAAAQQDAVQLCEQRTGQRCTAGRS